MSSPPPARIHAIYVLISDPDYVRFDLDLWTGDRPGRIAGTTPDEYEAIALVEGYLTGAGPAGRLFRYRGHHYSAQEVLTGACGPDLIVLHWPHEANQP